MTVKLLRVLALVTATMLMVACSHAPYHSGASVGVRGHYDSAYDDYYFYPDVSVYFSIHSGHYYYRPHRHWLRVDALPHHIYLNPRHRVKLHLHRKHPYRNYRDHHARFRFDRSRSHKRGYRRDKSRDHQRRHYGPHGDRRREREHTGRLRHDVSNKPRRRGNSTALFEHNANRTWRDRHQRHGRRVERDKRPRQQRRNNESRRQSIARGDRRRGIARNQRSEFRTDRGTTIFNREQNRGRRSTDDRMRSSKSRSRRQDRVRRVEHSRKRQSMAVGESGKQRSMPRTSNTKDRGGRAQFRSLKRSRHAKRAERRGARRTTRSRR